MDSSLHIESLLIARKAAIRMSSSAEDQRLRHACNNAFKSADPMVYYVDIPLSMT